MTLFRPMWPPRADSFRRGLGGARFRVKRSVNVEIAEETKTDGPSEADWRIILKLGRFGAGRRSCLCSHLAHDRSRWFVQHDGVLVQGNPFGSVAQVPPGVELIALKVPAEIVLLERPPVHALFVLRTGGKELTITAELSGQPQR